MALALSGAHAVRRRVRRARASPRPRQRRRAGGRRWHYARTAWDAAVRAATGCGARCVMARAEVRRRGVVVIMTSDPSSDDLGSTTQRCSGDNRPVRWPSQCAGASTCDRVLPGTHEYSRVLTSTTGRVPVEYRNEPSVIDCATRTQSTALWSERPHVALLHRSSLHGGLWRAPLR